MTDTLAPPFPPFRWDEYWWTGPVRLPAWAGLRPPERADAETPPAPPRPDGTVDVLVRVKGFEPQPPNDAQAAAFAYLLAQQTAIRDAILQAAFAYYTADYLDWRGEHGYDAAQAARWLPDLHHPDDLKPLIRLLSIGIFPTQQGGLAYVGYEFACTWDDEHGLGAMTHGDRIVELGQADSALLEWIATRDAARP